MAKTLSADAGAPTTAASASDARSRNYYGEIFLVSFAGLLLEISYTRVVSFKLFYYYTYLVIGLALLGIGAGGVFVAISERLRRAATETVLLWSLLLGAVGVGVGYLVVALVEFNSFAIWEYGKWVSYKNFGLLVVICVALSASFVAIGVVISTLFSRAPERIGRLYFADLAGAGIACAVVVSLIRVIGPPASIFLAGLTLALAALRLAARSSRRIVPATAVAAAVLALAVVAPGILPELRLEGTKAARLHLSDPAVTDSRWSPIFRVDLVDTMRGRRELYHDGILGSLMFPWDGKQQSLARFKFDNDVRALPFSTHAQAPGRLMIIGAAGGHEILASLYFDAGRIDAVELNPATHSLVTGKYADYTGRLAEKPSVNYVNGDGRSFLARSDDRYDVIWYPAPDSYSASNASTAGAFVLSESYLYTSEAIQDSLRRLGPDGIMVAQFGEIDYRRKPNRTTRYAATARHALARLGIDEPGDHILVATSPSFLGVTVSTLILKREAFTPEEVEGFEQVVAAIQGSTVEYAPARGAGYAGQPGHHQHPVGPGRVYDSYPYDIRPITDDRPFFWHFRPFRDVLANFEDKIDRFDREDTVGERVLLMLLAIAVLLAAVFLLLPFLTIRGVWTRLPRKGRSAVYFASLGLGFLLFEITLIQRLVLFLGHPTYSLTVTLASILLFTGVGALLSGRLTRGPDRLIPRLFGALVALTVFYLYGLTPVTDALQGLPSGARVPFAFLLLAPLGLCLGMFMPLGLGAVAQLTPHAREYVAWGWAVNGFASVIGSVLTTMLAMAFGFRTVLVAALAVYGVALVALRGLLPASRLPIAANSDSTRTAR